MVYGILATVRAFQPLGQVGFATGAASILIGMPHTR